MMDFLNGLDWPRDTPLPENPEEWPLIPKLELLAEYADLKDDERGALQPEQRTVQKDIRRTIDLLRILDEGKSVWFCEEAGRGFDPTVGFDTDQSDEANCYRIRHSPLTKDVGCGWRLLTERIGVRND